MEDKIKEVALRPCKECGMPVAPGEYHPYAACLMFKACHSSEVVKANLDAVIARGLAELQKVAEHSEPTPLYTHPQPKAATVPEGWKLVPVEPTPKMRGEVWDALLQDPSPTLDGVWEALLSAAPSLPAQSVRLVPDSECAHGKCCCTTTGCVGKCQMAAYQYTTPPTQSEGEQK